MQELSPETRHDGEQGFMLLGAIVLVFLVLLTLSVAAPRVARELRRDREVEAIHRGNEYVRAIQLYYRKFGHYPGNMDMLEKSNNIRFLRQKYVDPMTGKPDWRLIHVGEAKTTVKGFFGQPLAGLPGGGGTGGLGAASSMVSGQPTTTVGGTSTSPSSSSSSGSSSSFSLGGSSSSPGSGFSLGGSSNSPGSSSPTAGPGGTAGTASGPGGSGTSGSGSTGLGGGIGGQSATTFSGGGAPIIGVGSSKSGSSITDLNEQTTYETWEFLYDPRIEQLKAKAALLGGGSSSGFGSGSSTGSGSGFGSGSSGFGSSPMGGSSPTSPSSPGSSSPGGSSPSPR